MYINPEYLMLYISIQQIIGKVILIFNTIQQRMSSESTKKPDPQHEDMDETVNQTTENQTTEDLTQQNNNTADDSLALAGRGKNFKQI